MGEFYAECDEETNRDILRAQGEDPDETFSRWAANDDPEHDIYTGIWFTLENRVPDPGQTVIIRTNQNDVMPAMWTGKDWHCDDERAIGCLFTHWTAFPQPPIPF